MRPSWSPSGRALLSFALLVTIWVGSRAITREESFFLQGDPPRYLLNGAFLYDLIGAGVWRPADVVSFAQRYYARYPALSLGHHPPLLPASLVPFFAVFGVSVFAGRLAILAFFVMSVVLVYRLATYLYDDEQVAGWSSLLFASAPIIGQFGQRLLSEIPTIALMLAALVFVERFRRTGGLRNYLLFVAAAIASLLCRLTAIYMFPAYLMLVLVGGGHRHLAKGRVAMATLIGIGLLGGAMAAFLILSPFNAGVVLDVLRRGPEWAAVRAMYDALVRQTPLVATMTGGVLLAVMRADRRVLRPLVWIASVLLCAVILTGSIEPGRYSILAVPALCILGASPMGRTSTGPQRIAWAVLLIIAIVFQLRNTWSRPTWDTPGYEDAARFIVAHAQTPTVLYSASVDAGYFVFFVRKHDPGHRLVILRSDKLLTTSYMSSLSVEDRIDQPEEIFEILGTYGIRYVVIEDRVSGTVTLDWLRDLVKTDRFVERRRIPIGRGNELLDGVSLAVYEYLDATQATPDAELDLNIPLVGRRIVLPLSDLIGR